MKKEFKIVFIVGLTLALAFFANEATTTYIQKAQESEIKSIFAGYITAQDAYHRENGEYTADEQRLGYRHISSDVHMYLEYEKVPASYRKLISAGNLPYASKDSFKILLIKKRSKEIELWTVDDKREIMKHQSFPREDRQ